MDCMEHARLPCPSPTPGACSNSCPLTWECHPTILPSVIPFSSCLQSFPASSMGQNDHYKKYTEKHAEDGVAKRETCYTVGGNANFSSVQWLSHIRLFATPWTAVHQASLSLTNCWSLLKLMSIKSVMQSKHFIHCHPFLLLPSILPSIMVFSNESAVHIRWPKPHTARRGA